MYIYLVLLLVIFFVSKDYAHEEEKAKASASHSQIQVVSPSKRLAGAFAFADCCNTQSIECASLQRQTVFAQNQSSNDGSCDHAVALSLVQKTQQVLCAEVRFVLFELGKVHRHPLCPWAEAAGGGFTKGVIQKEVASIQRVAAMGDFDNFLCQASGVTKETPQDPKEDKGTEAQLWCPSAGSALAGISASTCAFTSLATFDRVTTCHNPPRTGDSDRAFRSTSYRGNPSSGRQGQETGGTASYCQIGATSLRQTGKEAQKPPPCHRGKEEAPHFMDQLHRRIHLTMEAVRRRFHDQRPRVRKEGDRSSRSSSRSSCPLRRGKGSERQTRCCCAGGRGGDLRWNGRGPDGQDCLCGRYQGRDSVRPGRTRDFPSHSSGGPSGSHSTEKAKDKWWRRRPTWIWLLCHEAFSSARQIDQWEICPGQLTACFEQPDHLVHQWNHSILDEVTFLNEWKANSQALELAFQVSMTNGLTFARTPSVHCHGTERKEPCISNRKVSFCDQVELYVGSEHDWHLQSWKHTIETPIDQSRLFRPLGHLMGDEVSFMAMGNHFPPHGVHETVPTALMEDRQIARDHDDWDHDIEVEVEPAASDVESSEAGTNSEHDWFSTFIFAIDFQPTPLRVDWNNYEAMHSDAAEILGVTRHQLLTLHHVGSPPQDFHDAGVEALIGHRYDDLAPGSTYRIVLIDVEFHSVTPEEPPEVVRRAARVPRQIGRLTLLNKLGLDAYCRATHQSCILWRNGEIASRYSALPLDISHGDYLRVVVPAGDHVASHIGTRCVASACQQGITLNEICDRHALFVLGWYDTIVGQPLVPLRLDAEDSSLLQVHHKLPPLPERPWFLMRSSFCRMNRTMPTDHFETDYSAVTRSFAENEPTTPPGGLVPRPGIDEQPEHVQNLLGQLEQDGAIEVEEEGQVLYVNTWFLDFPEHERCFEYRTVRIAGDFEHWNQQFIRAWRERVVPDLPISFHLVHPQPPTSRMQPMVLPHVIIMQRSPDEGRAAVITTFDSRGENPGFQHSAAFLPLITSKVHVIVAANKIDDCIPQVSDLQCMTWHGEVQLQGEQSIIIHHGISFLVILQNVEHMSVDAWDAEPDESDLMQGRVTTWRAEDAESRRSETENRHIDLNPHASAFQPDVPYIGLMSEFVQELSDIWRHCTIPEEAAASTFQVEVWFADHARGYLHCRLPRSVSLTADYSTWETIIADSWSDKRIDGEVLEYYVVDPSPPNMQHETVAHVVLIQSPQDQLVTSLLTVFETFQGVRQCTLQNAVTVHEHLYAEHLAQGLTLNPTIQRFEVWHGPHQLQVGHPWPARSGYSFVMEVHKEQRIPPAPILLQLSAIMTKGDERLTRGQVAHTHGPSPSLPNVAVEIRDLAHSGMIPQYLEVESPGTAAQVQEELQAWGHFTDVFDCWPQTLFVCRSQVVEEADTVNYLLCRNEVGVEHEVFVHTSSSLLSDNDMLRVLYNLGFSRAVLIVKENLITGWIKIIFSHNEPKHQERLPKQQKMQWPPIASSTARCSSPIIDLAKIPTIRGSCRLDTGLTVELLHELFSSGQQTLCRDFTCFDLPDNLKQHFEAFNTHQPLPDLTQFTRLFIFTDGTSSPDVKRLPPQHADEIGKPDAWAFLVIGEHYDQGEFAYHPIGWTAQVVRYDEGGSHYNGVSKIGSDMAERSALTWAALWRLSQNVQVDTVFCTDSTVGGAQAFGEIGVGDPDASFRLLRGAFQALQAALPAQALQWKHVSSHTGLIYNEFVDLAAKREAHSSFHHSRQQLDMRHWRSIIPYLWAVFAGPR